MSRKLKKGVTEDYEDIKYISYNLLEIFILKNGLQKIGTYYVIIKSSFLLI